MAQETQNKKFLSRKFLVWIVATVFETAAWVFAFVTQDFTPAQQFTNYWGGISLAYIGCNVAQDFAKKKESEE